MIAANVAAFGVELAFGASAWAPDARVIVALGANFSPLTLGGQPWRLLSSMFLHFGLIHLGMNMICLYQARVVEQIFGRLGYTAIYFASGLLGSVASIARGKLVVSAGASGAVFGVYGAFLAYLLVRRSALDPAAWQSTIRSVGIFLALNFAISLQAKGIDVSAHVGGVIGGFAVVAFLVSGSDAPRPTTNQLGPPRPPLQVRRPLRAVLALVVSVAISAIAVSVLPVPAA